MFEKDNKSLILSGRDVSEIVELFGLDPLMDLLIQKLSFAIQNFSSKVTEIPIRSGFNYNSTNNGLIEWMPVHRKGEEVLIKVVGYHPQNPVNFNLPTILSSISSYDTQTGHLKGIADGVLLTALRTGAASAVASKYLAKSDSSVLGLIGCGAQSVTQLHALSRVYNFNKVLIYDIDQNVVNTFKERISMMELNLEIKYASIGKIIENSDIVCTETSLEVGAGPLFLNWTAKEHLHVNAIGSDFPGKIELPLDFLRQCFVCPDFLEQAKIEGECQQLNDQEIGADLVELVQNNIAYKNLKNQLTVFDSTGWALEDQVVMDLFLELAIRFNIGLKVGIENISEDAKNPYQFLLKTVQA